MSSMCCPECIVYIDVAKAGELLRKTVVILFFFFMKAKILEQQHIAIMQHPDLFLRLLTHAIIRERNGAIQKVRKVFADWTKTVFLYALTLWPPQVRRKYDTTALLNCVLNGWQGRANTSVVLHFAVFDGNVEVNSDEDSLAWKIEIFYRK